MMITEHLAAGILLSNSNKNTKSNEFLFISLIASILPDLPVLFLGKPGDLGYLSHRIFSHSIILAPIYAIIPVVLGYLIFRFKLNNLFLFYLGSVIAYLVHIFLDYLTPYGVQLLYPLNKNISSLDLFHSFDPIFIFISTPIILTFIIRRYKGHFFSKSITLIYFGTILLYTSISLFSKNVFTREIEILNKSEDTETKVLAIVPRTFWRWKAISENPKNYSIIFNKNGEKKKMYFSKRFDIRSSISKSKEFKDFIDYARFPVILNEERDTLELANMVYSLNSYKLTLYLDVMREVDSYRLTGFDIKDNH